MRTGFVCLVCLAAIAAAEVLTALESPLWGIVFHFVILFALILSSAAVGKHPSRGLFLSLGLAPLIRIVSLSMPLAEFSQIYWYLIVSVPLLAGVFAVVRALNLRPREIGLTAGAIPLQCLVALAGIAFGLGDYFILKPQPLVAVLGWQQSIASALILLVAGFVEELAFRGVMQRASAQAAGAWGWLYVAVLYSVLQIGHLSATHCLFALLVALVFGWTVKRSGSILGVTLSHGLINVGLYLVFPFVF
jgi:membrane protease YdiL (CAAX protease family)